MLSGRLRNTDSDYPFGIVKLSLFRMTTAVQMVWLNNTYVRIYIISAVHNICIVMIDWLIIIYSRVSNITALFMKITKLQVINSVGGTVVGIGPIWVINRCLISLELTIYELCVKSLILLEILNIFLIFSEVYQENQSKNNNVHIYIKLIKQIIHNCKHYGDIWNTSLKCLVNSYN